MPGDTIEVNPQTRTAIRVLDRKPQNTIGIVRGISGGRAYLYCPLISPFYNPSVSHIADIQLVIGTRVLLHITKDVCEVKQVWTHISDRRADKDIIDGMYNLTPHINTSPRTYSAPLYTKPFQNLNALPTFTVDPTESRDFDDAISIVGNTVYVHIVDIHHLMPPDSELEKEAARLAFTLYTPEGNHNIVPSEYAESEWSLIKGVERRVITIEIRYTTDEYNIESYDIYPSTIIVKERYDYEHAPSVDIAKSLAERTKRTVYTIPQLKLSIDPSSGKVFQVKHMYSNDEAHRMIEIFMVTANMIVSEHLRSRSPSYANIPQRFHTKLRGLPTHPPSGDAVVDSFLAIKTFAYALYDSEKCGHYGLNLSSYTHFTSPIRRYFDVILHRMLAGAEYDAVELQTILSHINARELVISSLSQLYQRWKLLDTLHVGDTVDVIVTRVCAAGVYYLYKPYMLDGFIHVSALGGARWTYNAVDNVLSAPSSTPSPNIIRIGTCLKCRITEVDMTRQLLAICVTAAP
jgi:ribonuclease R